MVINVSAVGMLLNLLCFFLSPVFLVCRDLMPMQTRLPVPLLVSKMFQSQGLIGALWEGYMCM